MKRTLISSLATDYITLKSVKICGFVEKNRNTKNCIFLVIRDYTGSVQVFIDKREEPELASKCSNLTEQSSVIVEGLVSINSNVKLNGIELIAKSIEIVSLAPATLPISEDSSQELKMNWRFLELRDPKNQLIFELMTCIEQAMRTFWASYDFIEVHTPKLMGTASESGSELFTVPYFGRTAYLAQSPQFYKQMAMNAGFERVFEIGPVFRANPSFTSRHETEFISIDSEMAWIESHEDVMEFEERWIHYFMIHAYRNLNSKVKELYGFDINVPSIPFPMVTLEEAKDILKTEYNQVSPKTDDLSPEDERLLSDYILRKYGHDFVFVTDYPVSARPFYHMRYEDNPNLTKSFDLLYRGVEVTTGAQREHRYDVLVKQILEKQKSENDPKLLESLEDYLKFFQYGSVPHGGFGFGLARLVMKVLNLPNIHSVSFVSRTPKHLSP